MKKYLAIAAIAAVLAACIAPIDGCTGKEHKDGNGPGACEMLNWHIKAVHGSMGQGNSKWPGCARKARPWDYANCMASYFGMDEEKYKKAKLGLPPTPQQDEGIYP